MVRERVKRESAQEIKGNTRRARESGEWEREEEWKTRIVKKREKLVESARGGGMRKATEGAKRKAREEGKTRRMKREARRGEKR